MRNEKLIQKSATHSSATPAQELTDKRAYSKPQLECFGLVTEVTQKSGGSEDGGAAMMDKDGLG